jgi:hypothetical protein
MNRINGYALLVVTTAAFLSSCTSMQPLNGGGPQNRDAIIFLWRDGTNDCKARTFPYRLNASKGNKDKVRWEIFDVANCTADAEVSIRFDKGDADPFDPCTTSGKDRIECVVDEETSNGRHAYSVWLGTVEEEDPEIQIEM